ESLLEVLGDPEHATEPADVLAQHQGSRIVGQGTPQGLVDRPGHGDLTHGRPPRLRRPPHRPRPRRAGARDAPEGPRRSTGTGPPPGAARRPGRPPGASPPPPRPPVRRRRRNRSPPRPWTRATRDIA